MTSHFLETSDGIGSPGALADWLQQHTGQPVKVLQTHISWVLLAGECAYKLKKPVKLPFLDFSTLALRRHFCEEEVRLNQRLAAELYLDVVAVCGTPEAPWLETGQGSCRQPIDYAVRMRRFEADALMAAQVRTGKVSMADMRMLAQRLAQFHLGLPASSPDVMFGSPALVWDETLKVLQQLEPTVLRARSSEWRAWVDVQARLLQPVWRQRQSAGWIRECHGDLHLANVVKFQGVVTAFDCIEFQPAMRWIDVINDIAFLTMDLRTHGRADLAAGLMDDYLQATGDYGGLAVWRFYEVYRALVRAMVAQITTGGRDANAGAAYTHWLNEATRPPLAPKRLFIMHGFSGSGKSTVARELVEQAGAVRIRSDVERKRLFGLSALQSSHAQGIDIYTDAASRQTFDRLLGCAETALQAGHTMVVDAAFLRQEERGRFAQLAHHQQALFCIVHCHASADELVERIGMRGRRGDDASEATAAILARQQQFDEPFSSVEAPYVYSLDTQAHQPREAVAQLMQQIACGLNPPH